MRNLFEVGFKLGMGWTLGCFCGKIFGELIGQTADKLSSKIPLSEKHSNDDLHKQEIRTKICETKVKNCAGFRLGE